MRKWKKVVISIIAVFMVIFIVYDCIELGGVKWWYYRLYTGDRITINLTAEIDGKQIKADDIEVNISDVIFNDDREEYKAENSISVRNKDDYVTFSIRANDYGDYHINVNICGYSFMLNAYQWNWWDVQNTNLYIGIDTKKNEYTTHEEYSHISEECNVVKDSEPKATYEIDGINHISIGCKG